MRKWIVIAGILLFALQYVWAGVQEKGAPVYDFTPAGGVLSGVSRMDQYAGKELTPDEVANTLIVNLSTSALTFKLSGTTGFAQFYQFYGTGSSGTTIWGASGQTLRVGTGPDLTSGTTIFFISGCTGQVTTVFYVGGNTWHVAHTVPNGGIGSGSSPYVK